MTNLPEDPSRRNALASLDPKAEERRADLEEAIKAALPAALEEVRAEAPNMDPATQGQLARIRAKRIAKAIIEKPAPVAAPTTPRPAPSAAERPSAEVIQLSFWGEDYRAAPNAVFRSALFPALHPTQKQTRPFLKNKEIFAVSAVKVIFTGEQFDQSDLDVYLELLNMAQPFPLGTPVKFSAHALLKALGLPTGGSNHARLHSVLIRLCGGVVDISDHKKRYFGQLIHGGIRDEITLNYEIKINPDFALLFGVGLWGKIDLATRRALGRKDVAKVLQAYYSTHINPGFHDLETLYSLTGLRGINRKRDILKAHEALKAVGFCEGYELNEAGTGVRLVNMNQHPNQNRALMQQALKPAKAPQAEGRPLAPDRRPTAPR
jgi:hypothetical protein